ncbi:MAG TPA: hypothetical protein VFO65_10835 [Acidimicrobiales bacterium]|nr:hypothetical protein [Acidimicrobiales bacterium]
MPSAPRPVSAAAAFAVLDVSDKPPARTQAPRPPAPSAPVEPPPPPAPEHHRGVALGTVNGARSGRRRYDAVIYDGCVVLARRPRSKAARASRAAMTAAQLANVHPDNRLMADTAVDDVTVREDAVGGRARFKLRSGETVTLSWWGPTNRGVDAERLLHAAFPGRVDQSSPEVAGRVARGLGTVAAAVAVVMVLVTFVPKVFEKDPPPPPPPPPVTTLPPAEQALRAEVAAACVPWNEQVAALPAGTRPGPEVLRGPTAGMKGAFDNAAAASPAWTVARDELAYLQDYAGRPADAALRESVSRINYAIRTVSVACAKASSSQ